jgi:glycosyltransferase involved in cell wall biosynthesis
MQNKRLLMISTDRKIFEEGSAVRARQMENAKGWEEMHIIIFDKVKGQRSKVKSEAQGALETVLAPNCWAYSTGSWTKWMYPFDAMRLGRFFIEKRGVTDITCQDPFLTAMAGVALKKQFPQVNLEMQVHTDIGSPHFTYTIGNKVRKSLALSYLPKADRVRVVSNKIKDFLIEKIGVDASRVEVRPIFVDTEKIRTAPIIPGANLREKYLQFDKIVLVASRLEKEKNVGLAIEAWAKVIEKVSGAGLVIVGSGSEKSRLIALTSRLNLTNSIVFENWADQATLHSYYKTADLFLNTSLFEGYGMTLVESSAAGCRVVSTDVGVAQEVGATIVPFNDTEKSAEIIVQLFK